MRKRARARTKNEAAKALIAIQSRWQTREKSKGRGLANVVVNVAVCQMHPLLFSRMCLAILPSQEQLKCEPVHHISPSKLPPVSIQAALTAAAKGQRPDEVLTEDAVLGGREQNF
ncbi:hypothetical protein BaRGS_00033457 [Batillaria attramentaria]|uniref:Uncharacterized protein n=1 Tax=Batillaria attramentaria TaxID=370345 RepID=A0ABD0JK27_9CAEN